MLDMIALAFQSDTTRISTFMFGNAVSGVNFRFLEGVTDSHHEISHHSNNPEKLRQYAVINRWHVEQYGYLLRKLRDMKEGERSRAGQLDDPVRVGAQRRQQARSASPADRARRTRRRPHRVRPAPGVRRRFAGGEPVCLDARRLRNAGGAFCRQHRARSPACSRKRSEGQAQAQLQRPRRVAGTACALHAVGPNAVGVARVVEHIEEVGVDAQPDTLFDRRSP